VTLKSGSLRGHPRSFETAFDRSHTCSYWRSIVIISETERDIGRKSQFFIPLHSTPHWGGGSRNIAMTFGTGKLEWCGWLLDDEKSLTICLVVSSFDTTPVCDKQTEIDRRTSCHGSDAEHRSVKSANTQQIQHTVQHQLDVGYFCLACSSAFADHQYSPPTYILAHRRQVRRQDGLHKNSFKPCRPWS